MDDEVETPKPSKVKQLLPLVAMLLLGLGGGAGAMFFLAPKDAPEGEDGEEAAAEEAPAEAEAKGGEEEKGHGEAEAKGEEKKESAEAEAKGEEKKESGEAEAKAEKKHGGHEEVAESVGSITNLGQFTINLRGSGGGRILRLEVQVDADPESAGRLKELTPRIRDSIIAVVSDYTWSELEGTDGKTRLKEELLTRIGGIADPVVIRSVYLTNFVVS